jgi:hypothetical protein
MKKLCRLIDGMFVILILFHGITEAAQGWEANDFNSGINGYINVLVSTPDGIYAGGSFTKAGHVSASNIACWTGSEWISLGSGVESCGVVFTIAASEDGIYVGGYFQQVGGVTVNNIAFWDGDSWSAMDTGMNDFLFTIVYSIVSKNGRVVAGGRFTEASGHTVNNIAEWNGSEWVSLGEGRPFNCSFHSRFRRNSLYRRSFRFFSPETCQMGWNGLVRRRW